MTAAIALVGLDPNQPTAYLLGGNTRLPDLSVPHIEMVRTVAQTGGGTRWRLTRGAAAALIAVQDDLVAQGAELLRLTDAWRDQDTQARDRAGYDAWKAAGCPEPNSPKWQKGMKTAYAAKPGQSNHGWGASIDIDVGALWFGADAKIARGSNQALAAFWDVAAKHGWRPIIQYAKASQSEAWHFDHLGPLQRVHDLFVEAAKTDRRFGGVEYPQTALCGCILAGTLPSGYFSTPDKYTVAYVQARLNLAGHFAGSMDGDPGKMTLAACNAAGITAAKGWNAKTSPNVLIPEINELATDLLEAA